MSCTFSKDNIAVQNPEIINDLMQRLSKVSFLQAAAYKIYANFGPQFIYCLALQCK